MVPVRSLKPEVQVIHRELTKWLKVGENWNTIIKNYEIFGYTASSDEVVMANSCKSFATDRATQLSEKLSTIRSAARPAAARPAGGRQQPARPQPQPAGPLPGTLGVHPRPHGGRVPQPVRPTPMVGQSTHMNKDMIIQAWERSGIKNENARKFLDVILEPTDVSGLDDLVGQETVKAKLQQDLFAPI